MKLLLLPLAILSFSATAGAPDCKGLADIISNMEADLQKTKFSDCHKVEFKDSLPAGEAIDQTVKMHFEESRCEPLAKIELDISRLESQLATLRALNEFSKDLSNKNELLKGDPSKGLDERKLKILRKVATTEKLNQEVQQMGIQFQTGIKTAIVMETLLQAKSPAFLNLLKEKTAGGALTKRDLSTILSNNCPKADFCKEIEPVTEYMSDDAVLKDLTAVLAAHTTLDANAINAMKSAIRIEEKDKDGVPFSYQAIDQILKDNKVNLASVTKDSGLDKNLIKALKSVPNFKPSGSLPFTTAMADAKDALQTKAVIDSFKYVVKDVSLRNEMAIKSKLSAVMHKLDQGNKLPKEIKETCATLFDPKVSSEACLTSVQTHATSNLDNVYEYEKQSLDSIGALAKSNSELASFEAMCLDEQNLINNTQVAKEKPETLKDCNQSFLSEENILSKKLAALNLLRGKLLSENKRIQDFRNYAIQKMEKNTCSVTNTVSGISDCGGINMKDINPAINVLTGDILKVAVMYNADPDVDISDYCDEEKMTNEEARICEFEEGKNELPNTLIVGSPLSPANTEVESRADHDARMNTLQGAIQNIAVSLGQRNRTMYNPYNYNNPYTNMMPPMTISDSLTYNSVYYGGYSGYYPMANTSPFLFNSQLLGYTNRGPGIGSTYSYSSTSGTTSGYGVSSFLPTFNF